MQSKHALAAARAERNRIYRNCFLTGLSGLLAKMAASDGSVAESERGVTEKLFEGLGLNEHDLSLCRETFDSARDSKLTESYYASLFVPYSTRESRVILYEVLWDVAAADNHLQDGESAYLRRMIGLLELDERCYDLNLRAHADHLVGAAAVDGAVSKLGKIIK